MESFSRFMYHLIITVSLASLANSIVKFAILEYAVYSSIELWAVHTALAVALLLRCYAKKSSFLSYDRVRMRGKRTELRGINFGLFFTFTAVFSVNIDLIGRVNFGDGVTLVEQTLAVMAYSFFVPFVFRQIGLLSLRRRHRTISS